MPHDKKQSSSTEELLTTAHDREDKSENKIPLGARLGFNLLLAAAPPKLRMQVMRKHAISRDLLPRHVVRRYEEERRPRRRTRAERIRDEEMAFERERDMASDDWTPRSGASDGETGYDSESGYGPQSTVGRTASWSSSDSRQTRSRHEASSRSGSSHPRNAREGPGHNVVSDQIYQNVPRGVEGEFDVSRDSSSRKSSREAPTSQTGGSRFQTATGFQPPPARPEWPPSAAETGMGGDRERIKRWSYHVASHGPSSSSSSSSSTRNENRASVSTEWPGPEQEVDPRDSISVTGTPDDDDDEGRYRRGRIAHGSQMWSESSRRRRR